MHRRVVAGCAAALWAGAVGIAMVTSAAWATTRPPAGRFLSELPERVHPDEACPLYGVFGGARVTGDPS